MTDTNPSFERGLKLLDNLASKQAAAFGGPAVSLIKGDRVRPESITWLWGGWVPAGKLVILAGAPGSGKTTIALSLAATLSVGGRWPDGARAPTKRTVIWSGEDGIADTLAPRLHACRANMSMIDFVGPVSDHENGKPMLRPFDPSIDVPLLVDALAPLDGVGLLLIDPIVSAIAGDSHKNAETRRALAPLVELAAAKGCTVLGISHFSKGTAGRDPVERVTGSIAFGAVARVVLATAKINDPEAGLWRLFCRAKSNVGPDDGGFRYELEQVAVERYPDLNASQVSWGMKVEGAARELLARAENVDDPDAQAEGVDAKSYLREELRDGPKNAGEILTNGEKAGFPRRTIQSAATRLCVERHKGSMGGGWTWRLPPNAQGANQGAEDATPIIVAPSASSASSKAPNTSEGAEGARNIETAPSASTLASSADREAL